MSRLFVTAAAALLTSAGGLAAAPAVPAVAIDNAIVKVHGIHSSCQRGPGGWHRHNQWGERRPCRTWRGQGPRPSACVKVGPIYYCDY